MWGRGRARDAPGAPRVFPNLYLVERAAIRPKRPVMPGVRRTPGSFQKCDAPGRPDLPPFAGYFTAYKSYKLHWAGEVRLVAQVCRWACYEMGRMLASFSITKRVSSRLYFL